MNAVFSVEKDCILKPPYQERRQYSRIFNSKDKKRADQGGRLLMPGSHLRTACQGVALPKWFGMDKQIKIMDSSCLLLLEVLHASEIFKKEDYRKEEVRNRLIASTFKG